MWYKTLSLVWSGLLIVVKMERNEGTMRVMSEEQLEVLRHQISAYAIISDQLASMHSSMAAQQQHHHFLGGGIGISPGRQRWSPTAQQLGMLERIYEQGNGTPTKQKIKQIRAELSQHGQISETNVYNWFQNRRARSKRKPPNPPPPSLPPQVTTKLIKLNTYSHNFMGMCLFAGFRELVGDRK